MKGPKLKHPGLCRAIPYFLLLSVPVIAVTLIALSDFLPSALQGLMAIAVVILFLFFLFRELPSLFALDLTLASLSCMNRARTQYTLPDSRSIADIEGAIARFGIECSPTALEPKPFALRYSFKHSWTVYAKGIELVLAAYRADALSTELYWKIFSSGKTNSKALIGRKKPRFLDKQQKKANLHRVTMIVILAGSVEPRLSANLYKRLCEQSGDEFEDTVIPCVVDLERRLVAYPSERIPYFGFSYAVKNRGCTLLKKILFGGRLPLRGNPHRIEPPKDISPDHSLWQLWAELRHMMITEDRKIKKRFSSMEDRELRLEEDSLYIKWGNRGLILAAEYSEANGSYTVEKPEHWDYPKVNTMAKKTQAEIRTAITAYFSNRNSRVEFDLA